MGVETLPALLTMRTGLLARGPRRLLNGYAAVLEKFGMQPQLPPPSSDFERIPVFLLEIGENYVVAEHFEAERVE